MRRPGNTDGRCKRIGCHRPAPYLEEHNHFFCSRWCAETANPQLTEVTCPTCAGTGHIRRNP